MFLHRQRRGQKSAFDAAVRAAFTRLTGQPEISTCFRQLLNCVHLRSTILARDNSHGSPASHRKVIDALTRIASHAHAWARPVENWTTPSGSAFVQFRSLVNHLFARYPVPNLMAAVWLLDDDPVAAGQRLLFLHLGAGKSVRQFETRIRLTKGMARHFMQAPDDLTIEAALRWAQVRGLGGDSRLARTIVQSRLGAASTDEPFWESVIRFLISNTGFPQVEIGEIVEFIHGQRFEPAEVVVGPGAGREPLQPGFTIRDRTLMSLRRHIANWREQILPEGARSVRPPTVWPKTGIRAFRYCEQDRLWSIDELLSDRELHIEGKILQHCVARYVLACTRGHSSIWSMKLDDGVRRRRVLTIEVDPATKIIMQAKGRKNSAPDASARRMLNLWADQERLRFPGK
jgi:hypothetical protein